MVKKCTPRLVLSDDLPLLAAKRADRHHRDDDDDDNVRLALVVLPLPLENVAAKPPLPPPRSSEDVDDECIG